MPFETLYRIKNKGSGAPGVVQRSQKANENKLLHSSAAPEEGRGTEIWKGTSLGKISKTTTNISNHGSVVDLRTEALIRRKRCVRLRAHSHVGPQGGAVS